MCASIEISVRTSIETGECDYIREKLVRIGGAHLVVERCYLVECFAGLDFVKLSLARGNGWLPAFVMGDALLLSATIENGTRRRRAPGPTPPYRLH